MSLIQTSHLASGVHTEIDYPDRVSKFLRHGWGLYVEQRADPTGRHNNWFHIGIPYITSDRLSTRVTIHNLRLLMELNDNARLAEIHIRDRDHLAFSRDFNYTGLIINETITLGPSTFSSRNNPLTVCMRVEFLSNTPIGSVTFHGAGLTISSDNIS